VCDKVIGTRFIVLLPRSGLPQKYLDEHMRHRVGMLPDLIYFGVREPIGFTSENFATPRN
jgi:hypothetical protein